MGRTGHHEGCGRPNMFQYFTKYNNHNTNANKKKKETNLEEDILAGGRDVGRTGHHEDCGRPNLQMECLTDFFYHDR